MKNESALKTKDRLKVRGGAWGDYPVYLRAVFRLWYLPGYRSYVLGFRAIKVKANEK